MSDTTGANTGSSQGQNNGDNTGQTQDGQKGQQGQKGQNNGDNNGDNFDDLWQDPNVETLDKNKQTTQEPEKKPDPTEVFDEYIKGLDLASGLDMAKISGDLNQGNTESLDNAFSTIASNTYRQAMVDMSKVIDQKVEAGVAKAVQQSSNASQSDMAVKHMNTELNFTKNPVIAPVASAVLAQLIKKGKSTEDAVNGVREFFKQTSQLSAKELGRQNPPHSRPGNQRFDNPVNSDDAENEIDWMETLGV